MQPQASALNGVQELDDRLTAVEATTLDDLEQVIEKGLETFIQIGRALEQIRDRRLYRATHETFEDYCKERWKISRSYGYRQIEASQVAAIVSPNGDSPTPATESVARELAPLKDQPEQAREAWQTTVKEHGPKPTAKQAREVVKRRVPAPEKPQKPTKPHKREIEDTAFRLCCDLEKLERNLSKLERNRVRPLIDALRQRPDADPALLNVRGLARARQALDEQRQGLDHLIEIIDERRSKP